MSKDNGGNKEIDRLVNLIERITRVDTKLDVFGDQYRIDIRELRETCERIVAKVDDLEKRRSELVETVETARQESTKTKTEFDKWKIYWGAVAFIVAPVVTTIVVWIVHTCFGF